MTASTLTASRDTPVPAPAESRSRFTSDGTRPPVLDVVVPVYNEEQDLAPSVSRLHDHLSETFPYSFQITIADNASTDTTLAVAERLSRQYANVVVLHLDQKGRGRALRHAWLTSEAAVLAYCDVDLSTDLAALLPLVAPLLTGHSDLAIGSRLAPGSRVVRGPKREFISRCYNLILRGTLAARFSDAQCGFKAIRRDVARHLVPLVEDSGWFFDTELLVIAERAGLRIHEVPVDWTDDPDSRVDIMATALADLRGVARIGRGLMNGSVPIGELRGRVGRTPLAGSADDPGVGSVRQLMGQLMRFGAIGVVSTIAYVAIYAMLRTATGAQTANLIALLATAIANTAANRRLTFGVRGAAGAALHQFQGLVIFVLGLGVTSGSLAALTALNPDAGRPVELTVLVLANLTATLLRFVLLRGWVFRNLPARPADRAIEGHGAKK